MRNYGDVTRDNHVIPEYPEEVASINDSKRSMKSSVAMKREGNGTYFTVKPTSQMITSSIR